MANSVNGAPSEDLGAPLFNSTVASYDIGLTVKNGATNECQQIAIGAKLANGWAVGIHCNETGWQSSPLTRVHGADMVLANFQPSVAATISNLLLSGATVSVSLYEDPLLLNIGLASA